MKKEEITSMQISKKTWRIIHDNKEPGDSMEDSLLRLIKEKGGKDDV